MIGNKIKNLSAILVLMIALVAFSGSVTAISAVIDWVELDDHELKSGLNTAKNINKDNEVTVSIQLSALDNLENIEVEAMLSGYDHGDRVTAVSEVFDMKNDTYDVVDLDLKFPIRLDEDQYRLRIYVRDRAGDVLEAEYMLWVKSEQHLVTIRDVDVDPSHEVEAGRSVRVLVDVKNYGQKDEEVKVEFAIPELNLNALPDYMDVNKGDSETSEELYLRVPVCTEAGVYEGQVKATYDDGDEVSVENILLNVVESPSGCGATAPVDNGETTGTQPTVSGKTVITVGAQNQDLVAGEGGAIYPITFANSGSEAKTYTVTATGVDDWATVKISPLQTVTLGAGESKSVYVYVSAKEDAQAAEHMFSVDVRDSEGTVVKQIPLSASVAEGDGVSEKSGLRKALEIGLIVLVVILVIIALIVLFTRKKDDEDEEAEDEISGQTYY